jgi:hypothetical protein
VVCASQRGFLYPLTIGDELNFRLTYDGPLKAASQSDTRRLEKHAIRSVFSRQLWQFFATKNALFLAAEIEHNKSAPVNINRGQLSFFALVRESLNLVCDLDILFLRREEPGSLIGGGEDIDNRLKVLFDAFRIPQDDNEVRGLKPDDRLQSRVIFCLAEDDKLITGFRVTTDRLLEPATSEQEQNNVRLIINVEVKATRLTSTNLSYFSHF